MPFIGMMGKTKKSKDGGSGAWFNDYVYALKGGNTQEFWRYDPELDSWKELDTMPALGSTGKKKKVKAGADIIATGDFLYALKGNKTLEFWRYVPAAAGTRYQGSVVRAGIMAATSSSDSRLSIAPNPLRAGFVTVELAKGHDRIVGQFGSCPKLSIFDISGRILQSATCNLQSEMTLDLRGLPAGVYLVRLNSDRYSAQQKLVIER